MADSNYQHYMKSPHLDIFLRKKLETESGYLTRKKENTKEKGKGKSKSLKHTTQYRHNSNLGLINRPLPLTQHLSPHPTTQHIFFPFTAHFSYVVNKVFLPAAIRWQ